jgi:hypothetical protein
MNFLISREKKSTLLPAIKQSGKWGNAALIIGTNFPVSE